MGSNDKRCLPPGYTLVEIMVAVFITLVVMGGVYRTLRDESVNQERSEQILDMQNNARVALDRIARDVRRAGFLGCSGIPKANTLNNRGPNSWVQPFTIADATLPGGADWDGGGAILTQVVDDSALTVDYLGEPLGFSDNSPTDHPFYEEGTDAITLVFLTGERELTSAMSSQTADISVGPNNFGQSEILYVTDCEYFSLFQKTDSNYTTTVKHEATGINDTNDLGENYGQKSLARVYRLASATYFIRKDKFQLCYNSTGEAIANNIEDLQFQFLFDEDGDNDLSDEVWQDSLGAHESKDVRAVRIWLLAMSEPDFSFTDTDKYDYPNSPYAANSPAELAPITKPAYGEHRHRFFASAVVYLRNAGL